MPGGRWPVWLATLLIGLVGALIAAGLGVPVPWMIGPVLVTAALRIAGVPLAPPPGTRPLGQWAIGTGLGLWFTPEVVAELAAFAPAVAVGAAFALALGAAAGRGLARLTGVDTSTAYFACMPGGASEMANLAERYGARVDRVAAAHTLRVLLVVLIVPAAFTASGVHGLDSRASVAHAVSAPGLCVLVPLTLLGALVWKRLGPPNPWVIGPLFVTAALTATGWLPSGLPRGVSVAGQLAIGVALGCRFSPDFFRAAPRFLAGVAALGLGMIALAALFGAALGALAGLPAPAVVLGTSPGGIAEMCITAQALALGVPLVTSFHVIRMLTVVLASGPLYALLERRDRGG